MLLGLLLAFVVLSLFFGLAKIAINLTHTGFKNCIPAVFGCILGFVLYNGFPLMRDLIPGEPIFSGILTFALAIGISFAPMFFLRMKIPAILLYCFTAAPVGAMLILSLVDILYKLLHLLDIAKTELPDMYFSSPKDMFSTILFLIVTFATAIITTYTNYHVFLEEDEYQFEEGKTWYGIIPGSLLAGLASGISYLFLMAQLMRWNISSGFAFFPWWNSFAPFPKEDLATYPITGQACFETRLYIGAIIAFVIGMIAWYVFVYIKYKKRNTISQKTTRTKPIEEEKQQNVTTGYNFVAM